MPGGRSTVTYLKFEKPGFGRGAAFLALQASHVLRRPPVVTKRENVV